MVWGPGRCAHNINDCMVLGECRGGRGVFRVCKSCWGSQQHLYVQRLGTRAGICGGRSQRCAHTWLWQAGCGCLCRGRHQFQTHTWWQGPAIRKGQAQLGPRSQLPGSWLLAGTPVAARSCPRCMAAEAGAGISASSMQGHGWRG